MKTQRNQENGGHRGFVACVAMVALVALAGGLTFLGKQPAEPRVRSPVESTSSAPVQSVDDVARRVEAPAPAVEVARAPDSMHSEAQKTEIDQQLRQEEEPAQTSAWKAEKTRAIARVVSGRVARLDKEMSELERSGDSQGASRRRVLRKRLEQQLSAMDDEAKGYSVATTGDSR